MNDDRAARWSFWAGVAYLANIAVGSWAAIAVSQGDATLAASVNSAAALCYVVVTVLLYRLFAPTSLPVAAVAALASLAGCAVSLVQAAAPGAIGFSPLPFFGAYCLLTGWLVTRCGFLPRWIGWALMIGGIGWLTFALPDLRRALFPWNMAPAILAETALAVALLRRGVRRSPQPPAAA